MFDLYGNILLELVHDSSKTDLISDIFITLSNVDEDGSKYFASCLALLAIPYFLNENESFIVGRKLPPVTKCTCIHFASFGPCCF